MVGLNGFAKERTTPGTIGYDSVFAGFFSPDDSPVCRKVRCHRKNRAALSAADGFLPVVFHLLNIKTLVGDQLTDTFVDLGFKPCDAGVVDGDPAR